MAFAAPIGGDEDGRHVIDAEASFALAGLVRLVMSKVLNAGACVGALLLASTVIGGML